MTRKITAIITATLLILGLLPVGIALANVPSTASLEDGLDVYPGNEQAFPIRVNNGATSGGLPLPGLSTVGDPIRYVEVVFPTAAGFRVRGSGNAAPDGWTVIATPSGPLQTLTYRADEGTDGIPAESSLVFPVLADVVRPLDGDRAGRFRVSVSSNRLGDGRSESAVAPGGSLTSVVRVLEIIEDTIGATFPPGVTDGSGTATQTIEYGFSVFNHAENPLEVVSDLTSSRSSDEIDHDGDPVEIAGGGSETVTATITLGPSNSDTESDFTARATATNANPSAQSPEVVDTFIVHAIAFLEFDWGNFRPTHVQNQDPDTYTFRVPVTKRGTQSLTLEEGDLTFCSGTFSNVVGLKDSVDFGAGTDSGKVLEFGPIDATSIDGPDDGGSQECNGTFDLSGPDGNDFDTTIDEIRNGLITIDNLIPVITVDINLPNDEDGQAQVRATNGNDIEVTGSVSTGCATLDRVRLAHADGEEIAVTNRTAEGGWTNESVGCTGGNNFNVTFQDVDFGVADDGEFVATARATSPAGRPGSGETEDLFEFDTLAPHFTRATTMIIDVGEHAGKSGILAHFEENFDVLGGCNPRQWAVSGFESGVHGPITGSVTNVLFSNGDPCEPYRAGPDNDRILVLSEEFGDNIDATPDVTYTPADSVVGDVVGGLPVIGDLYTQSPIADVVTAVEEDSPLGGQGLLRSDRAKDGAGLYAVQNIVKAIEGIVPELPDILQVRRNNNTEPARFDEGAYWTRFGGNDLQARIGGARAGYLIEVLTATIDDEDNCIPGTRVGSLTPADGEGDDWTRVGIGTAEGEYTRAVRLLNNAGFGPSRCFVVGLDLTAPSITGVTAGAGNSVVVQFNEALFGSNIEPHWYVWEEAEIRDDQVIGGRDYYPATGVSGSRDQRTLDSNRSGDRPLGGADYRVLSDDEDRRLEDRAGWTLDNTVDF